VLVFGKKRLRLIKILLLLQHVADRVWLLQLQSSDHNDIIIRRRNEQQIGLCGPCALASQCLGLLVAAGVSKCSTFFLHFCCSISVSIIFGIHSCFLCFCTVCFSSCCQNVSSSLMSKRTCSLAILTLWWSCVYQQQCFRITGNFANFTITGSLLVN